MKEDYKGALDYYSKAIKSSQNDENIKSYESAIARVEKKMTYNAPTETNH